MMSASILFWLLLPLPGYALARRVSSDEFESGLLGSLGISYLYTFTLLSPVAIACYVLRLPVGVLSAYFVMLFVAAAIDLSRNRGWGAMGRLWMAGLGVELLIVLLDLVMGARVGTFLAGDAFVHLARIRSLLENGMNNDDPFVAARHFFPVYHTNLLHAMYAMATQLTRCDLLNVWFDSLPMGKLLIASGTYYFAWQVFQRRWVAWIAVMFVVGVRGPFQYVIYPNQLSPYFLTPMVLGILVSAVRGPCTWRHAAMLAAASLIIGQFHGLYVLFCLIGAGPVLGAVALYNLVRRPRAAMPMLACAVAMWVGFPFLLVSRWQTPVINRAPVTETAPIGDSGYFVRVGANDVVRDSTDLVRTLGGGVGNTIAWFVGIGCALAGRRRRETGFLLGIVAVSLTIFFVPTICSFFMRRLGEEWVLQRFDYLIGVCQIALVPGAIAAMVERVPMQAIGRSIVSVVVLFLAAGSAGHQKPDDWTTWLGTARLPHEQRTGYLGNINKIRNFVMAHVPPGETVLADSVTGIGFVAITGNKLVIADRACNGVSDQYERRDDLAVMLDPRVSWERKLPLLRKYQTRYFFPVSFRNEWTEGHVEAQWSVDRRLLIKLKID